MQIIDLLDPPNITHFFIFPDFAYITDYYLNIHIHYISIYPYGKKWSFQKSSKNHRSPHGIGEQKYALRLPKNDNRESKKIKNP